MFIQKERIERGDTGLYCGPRVSPHQTLLVVSLQPSFPPSGQSGTEVVSLHSTVTASPQLAGGVGVGPVQGPGVYEGAVDVDLLPGLHIFGADRFRPRECQTFLLVAVKAVLGDVDVEAVLELLARLIDILLENSRVTAPVIW